MQCPKCGSEKNKVIDTRKTSPAVIQRYRECLNPKCQHTWRTYESAANTVMVPLEPRLDGIAQK